MAIFRYNSSADNTISNAFASNLKTRATGSNMGESDVLEVFSIHAQASTSSIEKSRILIDFPIDTIIEDRAAGKIPASGSVSFYLKLTNAVHSSTLPKKFNLIVAAVSQSWSEGFGLDMEEYSDYGHSNWISPRSSSAGEVLWTTPGGDFIDDDSVKSEQFFEKGTEDLIVNVSSLVEKWIDGTYEKNGFGIFLSGSQEDGSEGRSYYTKKFFDRGSEFFFKRPVIEARWNSSFTDDESNFYRSSSLAPAADNLNTLFLVNRIRGKKVNIPSVGTNNILASVYSQPGGDPITLPVGGGVVTNNDINVTGSNVEEGIYKVQFAYTGSSDTIYLVWHSGSTEFVTSSAITVNEQSDREDYSNSFHITLVNSKPSYATDEVSRFRFFTRKKDWSPTIYTKASKEIENHIVEEVFYKINRSTDGYEVIGYGTGSESHTKLSYDKSGSYFDLDMSLLQEDYQYQISLLYSFDGEYREFNEKFKFRVDKI